MPGLVGLITKQPREWAEPRLQRMVQALRHESFYVHGTCVDEPSGVYAGWVARKNSFAEKMPLCNERQDVSLLFAGEEFPEPGTVHRLQEKGHHLNAQGPSYLVHLYEGDAAFPAVLNGRFHGLLTDRSRGITKLFNDRYGLQRVYYHDAQDAFYFAAEAKAILAICPELRRLDLKALGEFIGCGCVMENRTLFEGIDALPPGSAWTFRGGVLQQKAKYFDPKEWESQSQLDPDTSYQQLKDVFSRNLPRYFDSSELMAVSLTGGLDTRMIMAWHKALKNSLPCYSFGGTYRDCQDVIMAQEVAQICGQTHQVITLGQDFLRQFPHYAERAVYLTDGCTEVNRAADLYLNQHAREIAPMRMTGNYGSEVLRRTKPRRPNTPTPAFKPVDPLPGLFRPEVHSSIQAAKQTYANALQTNAASFAVFRQAPWHHYGLLALEETQVGLRTPYLDNDLVRAVYRAPLPSLENNDVCLRLVGDGDPELRRLRTDRGLGGNQPKWLASLTRDYLEFTFKAEYAYDYGMPQRVAAVDHVFSPLHLERLFLGRHKFAHYRVWYRDVLAGYIREMLLDAKTLSRPYLEKQRVESIVDGHLKRGRNYTTEIHKILSLELIHRLFLDS